MNCSRRGLLAGLGAIAALCGQERKSAPPRDLQLFLLIGQSNMAGRGAVGPEDREPIPGVFMLNKQLEWVPATDPMHYDKPEIIGVGLGRSFARVLKAENPTATIGLIPAAFGGSSLEQWKPGGDLYVEAVRRAKAAMKAGTLRGVLWHQGEADSGDEGLARSYGDRWSEFIRTLRSDLGSPNVPVVVGQLGEFFGRSTPEKPAYAAVVNEQLALLPLRVAHTAFVSSAGLVHKGDNTHFDTPSLHEFGRRYGYAYLSLDPSWAAMKP